MHTTAWFGSFYRSILHGPGQPDEGYDQHRLTGSDRMLWHTIGNMHLDLMRHLNEKRAKTHIPVAQWLRKYDLSCIPRFFIRSAVCTDHDVFSQPWLSEFNKKELRLRGIFNRIEQKVPYQLVAEPVALHLHPKFKPSKEIKW